MHVEQVTSDIVFVFKPRREIILLTLVVFTVDHLLVVVLCHNIKHTVTILVTSAEHIITFDIDIAVWHPFLVRHHDYLSVIQYNHCSFCKHYSFLSCNLHNFALFYYDD